MLVIIFSILLEVFNMVSNLLTAFKYDIGPFTIHVLLIQYPHMITPLAYSFGMIIYLVAIDVAFLIGFTPGIAFWVSLSATVLSYVPALYFLLLTRIDS